MQKDNELKWFKIVIVTLLAISIVLEKVGVSLIPNDDGCASVYTELEVEKPGGEDY